MRLSVPRRSSKIAQQHVLAALVVLNAGGCAAVLQGGLPISSLAAEHSPEIRLRGEARLYTVRGATTGAIERSLDRRAIWSAPGAPDTTWHAGTTWWFEAAWSRRPSDTGCALRDPRLEVRVDVTVPVWHAPRHPDEAAAKAFEAYTRALWEHELGHVDRALDTADDLLADLAALPMGPDCTAVDRQADALLQRHLADLQLEQQVYDDATNHGATQGARFP